MAGVNPKQSFADPRKKKSGMQTLKKKGAEFQAAKTPKPPPERPTPKGKEATGSANWGINRSGGGKTKGMTGGVKPPPEVPTPPAAPAAPGPQIVTAGKGAGVKMPAGPKPPPERPTAPSMHTIQRGDTLTAIAKKYGTTVEELARKNKIKNPDLIYAGASLKL